MINDGVTQRSQGGDQPVAEVADIASLLLASVDRSSVPAS
jgi:hypothetical protein